MSVKLEIKGLVELREALRRLPEALTDEAATIVEAHAAQAQSQIVQAYPVRSTGLRPTDRRKSSWFPPGNLRRGVTMNRERLRFTTKAIVRSRAHHAHLFERGTGPRRHANGANRGRMPEAPESKQMIPIVIRRRRAMVEALKDLVRRAGFKVS